VLLLLGISQHQPKLRPPCPVTADTDSERGSVVAGGQRGMLQLHLGRLEIALFCLFRPT